MNEIKMPSADAFKITHTPGNLKKFMEDNKMKGWPIVFHQGGQAIIQFFKHS